MRLLGLLAAAVLLGAGLWLFAAQASGGRPASPFNETNLLIGYEVYQSDCGGCHGLRLQGARGWKPGSHLAPPLAAAYDARSWTNSDRQLFRVVTSEDDAARRYLDHRQFETSLAPMEVNAVIAFLKAHWTPRERLLQALLSANPWSVPWPWTDLTWRAPPGCFEPEPTRGADGAPQGTSG